MPSPAAAGWSDRRGPGPRRLTRRVFWDLAIYMVGLGLVVGAVFPPFAVLLGVRPEEASRPVFVVACLLAGFLVGALNHGLSRVVVGRRLGVLSARLRSVADTIATASLTGEWGQLEARASRIAVDSDDELGETARAFNSLLDALAAGEHSRSLVHNSSDIITVVDRAGEVRYQTPSVGWVLGLPPATLIGRPVRDLVHPDDAAGFDLYLATVRDRSAPPPAPVRVRMRHSDGSWRSVETAASNLLDDPAVSGVVLTTRDISDRLVLEERLRHQAFHDSLTGLPNRALFMERVAQADAGSQVSGATVAVLYIDLDNLKIVNDAAGHQAGDALLATVAERLSAGVAPEDTAARLGGDEFAVLLVAPGTATRASEFAEQLLADLAQPALVAGRQIRPGVSIGVATSDSLGGATDLVRAADGAMYAAKRAGKGRVEVHRPSHHRAEMARQQLRADLQQALDGDQFVLHYQPVVDLVTGRITGFEALLRWEHPTLGLLPPGEFVPLAEESDLILPIGRWVLHQACQHAGDWQRSGSRGAGVRVSVNLSARQFRDQALVEEVARAVRAAHLDPRLLTVELTETLLLQDSSVTTRRIEGLRELGVTLALDDFGTGYSSLSYLRRFPIDILKMDRSFLDEVPGDVRDEALVRGIVDLGGTLGLQVVAEGVETAEQAAALARLGCPFGQGFHFARPMPFLEALHAVGQPRLPLPPSPQRELAAAAAGSAVPPTAVRRYGS
ncbi:bifunctional diguanylate cyclase/phosphodiesterase [uncultured Pseudokineococcus sp.]|uniref:putative bifunctional diguanylate cyclase/phosphodiesterase n=1 Tax=uncultured Pseudokineococcus sp. TaxID=1642928 RepID=UPI0026300B63|nr:EAL domain-containing protein [uncultured Pseudokineococcus sp.]